MRLLNSQYLLIQFKENKYFVTTLIILISLVISYPFFHVEFIYFLGFILFILMLSLFFTKIKWFLYIFLSLLSLRDLIAGGTRLFSDLPIDFDIGGLVNIITIFLGAAYFIIKMNNPFNKSLSKTYSSYLIFCALSLTYSPNFYDGLRLLARLISPFVIYLILCDVIKNEKTAKIIIKCIFISSIIPLGLGFSQFFLKTGDIESAPGFMRIMATFYHPTNYACYLLMLFALSYSLFLSNYKKRRLSLFLYILIITISIALTYTRIAWIAFLSIFIFLNFIFKKNQLTIFAFVIIIPLLLLVANPLIERFSDVAELLIGGELTRTDISLGWRFNAWVHVFDKFKNHPWIGNGLGSSLIFLHELYGIKTTPHNEYLRILVEIGVLGFCLFSLFIFSIIRFCKKSYIKAINPFEKAICYSGISLLLVILIYCISDNILVYYSIVIYFWAIWAIQEWIRNKEIGGKNSL